MKTGVVITNPDAKTVDYSGFNIDKCIALTNIKSPKPHDSCHRCRRDRDDLSCIDCPKYVRRALFESLEEGLLASIAGLYVLIFAVYLYEVAS